MLILSNRTVKNLTGEELYQFFRDRTTKQGTVKDEFQVFRGFLPSFEKVEDDPDAVGYTFSSADVDSYGDIVEQAGWDLSRYEKNPVILWAHDHRIPAIGYSKKTWIDGNLKGQIKFNPKEVDEFAAGIKARIDFGSIKAGSVGFQPLEWKLMETGDDKHGDVAFRFIKQSLMEFSICNVPANPFAVVDPKAAEPEKEKEVTDKPKTGFESFIRSEQ